MNRCHICGKKYGAGEECQRCKPMRELFGEKFGLVADWVLAMARDAADDAVLGHCNDEDHSGVIP
jgi:hypothetical protein